MCIAIASPIGSPVPTLDILHNCWNNNDDGAGFAFNYNGKVYIKKGFMTFDSFIKAFDSANKTFNLRERGVLIHFRIATHGGVCPEMCHPFPIADDNDSLCELERESDYAVVHNGIISLTSAEANIEKDVSDTAVFVRDYLTLIAKNRQWMKKKSNIELIDKLIDSKMAILDKNGNIVNTSGFTECDGILYSNNSYKSYNYKATSSYSYNDLFDDNDDFLDFDYNKSYQSVPLMRCSSGDTIVGDSVEYYCDSYVKRDYALSKEGYLYHINSSKDSSDFKLEYVGFGSFYDKMNNIKNFTANYWPIQERFLNDSYPEALNAIENSKFYQ